MADDSSRSPFQKALGLHEIYNENFIRCLFSEFLGTFFLIVAGCGSAITIEPMAGPPGIDCAFLFGMTVATIVWTLGHLSGAHINPVVSLCFTLTGKLSIVRLVCYTFWQCAGAIAGSAVLWYIVPPPWRQTLGSTVFAEGLTVWQGFAIELLCTFFLMLSIFSCEDHLRTDHAGSVPLTIGFIVFVQSTWAGKLTGCSMNPARTLGPALVSGAWDHHWVYWLAPTAGGVLGSFLYKNFLAERSSDAASKLSGLKLTGEKRIPRPEISIISDHDPAPPSTVFENKVFEESKSSQF